MEHPLRTFRLRRKISLDQLALDSGVSKASLSRIETGQQQPSFETIKILIDLSIGDEVGPLTAEDFVNFPKAPAQTASAA